MKLTIEGFAVSNFGKHKKIAIGRTIESSPDAEPLSQLTAIVGEHGSGKTTLLTAFDVFCRIVARGSVKNVDDLHGFIPEGEKLIKEGDHLIGFELCYRGRGERLYCYKIAIDVSRMVGVQVGPNIFSEQLVSYSDIQMDNPRMHFHRAQDNYVSVHRYGRFDADWEYTELKTPVVSSYEARNNTMSALKSFSMDFSKPSDHLPSAQDCYELFYAAAYAADVHAIDMANSLVQNGNARIVAHVLYQLEGITGRNSIDVDKVLSLTKSGDSAIYDLFIRGDLHLSKGEQTILYYLLLFAYLASKKSGRGIPPITPIVVADNFGDGIHPKALAHLVDALSDYDVQFLFATHSPIILDCLDPKEVWAFGEQTLANVGDMELVKNLHEQGMPLGDLWYSGYFFKQ